MIVVEQANSVVIASRAWLVEDPDEIEMAWAEELVRDNKLYAWLLGKYVGANEPNANGHIFDAGELVTAVDSLAYAPLNMLHRPHSIMGTYAGARLIHPTEGAAADLDGVNPFVKSLAAFWRYYFQKDYRAIQRAHKEGTLAQSMECLPESVTCMNSVCGQTFAYAGRHDDSYCAHLNTATPPRRLNLPHFSGGGIILPPARPAWRAARITELQAAGRARMAAAELDGTAEGLYRQVAAEFAHLGPLQWEEAMALIMAMASLATPRRSEPPSSVATEPHLHECSNPDDGESPCKVPGCGRGPDDPIHRGFRPATDRRASAAAAAQSLQGSEGTETSAMVAFYPSPEVAAGLAMAGGEPPAALHVTLAYLGPKAVLEVNRARVEAALLAFAAFSSPVDGQVSGLGRFSAGYPAGQEPWPLYASIDIPALPEFRERLVATLGAVGVPVAADHGFSPHMTLAYVDADTEEAATALLAQGLEPVPLHFSEIVLAWGDARYVYPLSAGAHEEEDARSGYLKGRADPPSVYAKEIPLGPTGLAKGAMAAIVAAARAEVLAIPVWCPEAGRSMTTSRREQLVTLGYALPDRSFPIETVDDLRGAIRALARVPNPRARAHVIRRGKALRATQLLQDAGLLPR